MSVSLFVSVCVGVYRCVPLLCLSLSAFLHLFLGISVFPLDSLSLCHTKSLSSHLPLASSYNSRNVGVHRGVLGEWGAAVGFLG